MATEYDIRGGARRCAKTDRVLKSSDHYFSVLREEGEHLVREDYASDAWQAAPEDVLAWWESRPTGTGNTRPAAPNEVLLKLFDQWAEDQLQAESRYVLTLLLVRRKVFRVEPTVTLPASEPSEPPLLRVYCARRDESYDIPEHTPDPEQAEAIQQYLSSLLAA